MNDGQLQDIINEEVPVVKAIRHKESKGKLKNYCSNPCGGKKKTTTYKICQKDPKGDGDVST